MSLPPDRPSEWLPPRGGGELPLDGLVDLILDMAVLTDPEVLLSRALRKLQTTFPSAMRGAHLSLDPGAGRRIHPASWSRGSPEPLTSVREDALAQFDAVNRSLLLPALDPGPVSVILVPIRSRGRLTGILYLASAPGGPAFTDADLRLATAAAMAITIGLDNSLLYTELLTSLEFNEGILQGLGSGLLATDGQGVVRKINAVGLDLLGLTAAEVLRRPLGDVPILAPLVPLMERVAGTGQRLDRQEVELVRGPERLPLGLTLVPLRTASGRIEGAIANFRDLTHVRRLGELVRRGQRLAALGEMAAGVAHEIRNPLNSIRGFVELIQERTAGEDRRYMQIVVEEVERINHIVEGLLDFARQQDIRLAPMDLSPVAVRVMALVAAAAERRHVRLSNRLPEACRVIGNTGKIEQVLLNLVQNAMEAVPDGGDVTLLAVLREEGGVPGWAVHVSDTGCGIPAEDLEKLFTPFFTRKEKGTGLGLAICHKIVEAHCGRIEVSSEAGTGTTFTVWLPQP